MKKRELDAKVWVDGLKGSHGELIRLFKQDAWGFVAKDKDGKRLSKEKAIKLNIDRVKRAKEAKYWMQLNRMHINFLKGVNLKLEALLNPGF